MMIEQDTLPPAVEATSPPPAPLTYEEVAKRRAERNIKINQAVHEIYLGARKVVTPLPKLATPFVPADPDEISPTCCWFAYCLDIKGRKRRAFLRGPARMSGAITAAESLFRNWTILKIEPTEETQPTANMKPAGIANEAHSFRIMESVHSRRLR